MKRRLLLLVCSWSLLLLSLVACGGVDEPPSAGDDPEVERNYRADPAARAREALLRAWGQAAPPSVELRDLAAVGGGLTRARFALRSGGLAVDGGDAIVVLRADGSLREVAGLDAARAAGGALAAAPRLEAQDAERAALAGRPSGTTVEPATALVALPRPGGALLPAWRVVLNGPGLRREVFVDAATGSVAHEREGLRAAAAEGSGVGVHGDRRALVVWRGTSGYELRDAARRVRTSTAAGGWSVPGEPVRSEVLDRWDEEVFGAGAAVDAHASGAQVIDYLARVLGRDGWDGDGGTLRLVVHAGNRVDNAFWDGRRAVFGDGDGATRLPLSGALDVVAHEIFHGVVESEVALIYEGQSGALSESLSDVFGTLVELDRGGGDWLMGAEIADPPLRDLAHPWRSGGPAHMDDYQELAATPEDDMGGVHINCSIPSFAAALLAEGGRAAAGDVTVEPIGRDRLREIWWRAVTVYLTPRASFRDFARATVLAAEDLYAADVVAEVRRGWAAVGIAPRK